MSEHASWQQLLADEQATIKLGQQLAQQVREGGGVLYLEGDLGAGKTTLSRGIVQALGHQGAVKSPTYTLVEPYELGGCHIFHFDLYRLADPEELEYVGVRDFLDAGDDDKVHFKPVIMLIEWPENGLGCIPEPDLKVNLQVQGSGRAVKLEAISKKGLNWLGKLTNI